MLSRTNEMPYTICLHHRVERFLSRNHTLEGLWALRREELANSPTSGRGIRHLVDEFFCNYRLRLDVWRVLYEVDEQHETILVYRARPRDHAYDP